MIRRTAALSLVALGIGALIMGPLPVQAGEELPHWSYGGTANPSEWGNLSHDFALCEVGRDQSPINIDRAFAGSPAQIEFDYVAVPLVVVNNGHTIQVNYEPGSTVTIDGEEFELRQFHFHTPSEHTTSGHAAAMELHLVHQNDAGQLAVVGVMMEEGTEHAAVDTVWAHIPEDVRTNVVEGMTINAADFLPESSSYFSYAGSLTTPPCSEGVRWNVLMEPIYVSEEQIATFEQLYQVNARPVQPVNGRLVELHE